MAMDILEELSKATRSGRSDIADGISLIGRMRDQFEADLAELESVQVENSPIVH